MSVFTILCSAHRRHSEQLLPLVSRCRVRCELRLDRYMIKGKRRDHSCSARGYTLIWQCDILFGNLTPVYNGTIPLSKIILHQTLFRVCLKFEVQILTYINLITTSLLELLNKPGIRL